MAMQGVVFTEFLDHVEAAHGLEVLDEVLLAAAPANGGAYTAIGSYHWREFAALVVALSARLGCSADAVLRAFGLHLFPVLMRQFPVVPVDCGEALESLARLADVLHPAPREPHPVAEPPALSSLTTATGVVLHYRSPWPFGALALGLVEGCLAHFGAGSVLADGVGGRWTFTIELPQEAACTSPS